MSDAAILAVLKADGLLHEGPSDTLSLELLTVGFWNRVYRLRSKEDTAMDWVVKQFVQVPVNPLFPILPNAEYAALQFLENRLVRQSQSPLSPIAPSVACWCTGMSRVAVGMVTL